MQTAKVNYLHYHDKVDNEVVLVESERINDGHKLFSFSFETNKINELDHTKLKTIDYGTGEGYALLMEKYTIYTFALNLQNAAKKILADVKAIKESQASA